MHSNKYYNKKRHLELLKYSQELEQQGKYLFQESKKDSSELIHYSARMEETRDQYLELINKFMNEKIDISEFCTAFCRRSSLNTEVLDILQSNFLMKNLLNLQIFCKKY